MKKKRTEKHNPSDFRVPAPLRVSRYIGGEFFLIFREKLLDKRGETRYNYIDKKILILNY